MAVAKIPLMLDGAMAVDLPDVDDLFGDNVTLPLPLHTHGKQHHGRLDELMSRGCCQSVAWSRSGTIASITPDGQALQLRFLRSNPGDGSWDLSEPTTSEMIKGTPSIPLVHLEWGPTHTPELAIVDAVGRVTIASFSITLNHPFITRRWDADAMDDVHSVVGCHWLNGAPFLQQKPFNILYGPAVKNGNSYQYETSLIHAGGPIHPHSSKSALLCVTMGGMLNMFWSQNNQKMDETLLELESINSSDELITHAALASDRKFLLVAIATSSLRLELLRVEIQWAGSGSSSDRNPMPQNARLNPALVETHLASTSWLYGGPDEAANDGSAAELSHLHVLPSVSESTGKCMAPPVILTIRSRPAAEGPYQAAHSIIDRWEVTEKRQSLHPTLEQLGNRRSSISSDLPTSTRLRKLDPIFINKVVIDIQSVQFGKLLLLAMSDGSVEYRDRFSFEELYVTEDDLTKIGNLRQVGWDFAAEEPCQQVAFSPTCCSMVQMCEDGKMRWNRLRPPAEGIGNSMQESRYAATVAALAVTAASAICYQSSIDDMLATVHSLTANKRFSQDWVSELVRVIKIQVDYNEETHHESLMRNAPLQSCLSIMNSLGFEGEWRRRSFQSKLATLNLNMRNVVIMMTLASNTPVTVREKMNPMDEHEVVDMLAGCVEWGLDLLCWLTDSLFGLMNDDELSLRLVPARRGDIMPYLVERNEVCLHLVLCSCSRGFLSALCRRIVHLEDLSNKTFDFYRRQSALEDQAGNSRSGNRQLQKAYQRLQHVVRSSPIKLTELENVLNVLGSDIRQAYQHFLSNRARSTPVMSQGKLAETTIKTAQLQHEMSLLLATSMPMALLPVVKKLFCKVLLAFRDLTDPAELFFADYRRVGADDDGVSLVGRRVRGVYVDVFRRVELRRSETGPAWRRCTRCASVMEDTHVNKPGYTFLLAQQRRCSCGGYWALLPAGKLVA